MKPHLIFGDPIRKKKSSEHEKGFLIRCPRCNEVNTVKSKNSHSVITCPWCKAFFTPAHSESRFLATGWDNKDSLTDWDEL